MASIRQLKKDVDYLSFAVIDDCLTYRSVSDKHDNEVIEIIQSTIQYRNEMRTRINTRQKFEDKKAKRAYFKGLAIDLLKNVDGQFTRLSELVKA